MHRSCAGVSCFLDRLAVDIHGWAGLVYHMHSLLLRLTALEWGGVGMVGVGIGRDLRWGGTL